MSKLLDKEVIEQVKEAFQALDEDLQILFFEGDDCEYCSDTQQLVEEVADLTDKIHLNIYHLDHDQETAKRYNVDKAPGLVIASQNGSGAVDHGIRYAGIPSGHEFSSLIQSLLMVSSGDSNLSEETLNSLNDLEEPVHLQVFVTPSCPYCPQAVVLAHSLALASENVQAEMVETSEFMELTKEFNVSGVPDTLINQGAGRVVGAVPEENLIAEIQKALTS